MQFKRYVEDFVRGPVLPSEDWATLQKIAELDCDGEEIKLPEATTWAQIAPALPPADLIARVRAIDLVEGPIRVLQAKVWVASDSYRADSCKGCRVSWPGGNSSRSSEGRVPGP